MNKKKIALIIDTEGWAFDNIAHRIQENLTEFDIDIIPGRIFKGNMIKLFIFCQDYDLIHFMWRGYISLIDREEMRNYCETLGMSFEEFKEQFIDNKKITFAVCDELYLEGEEKWRTEEIMKYVKSYFVTSKRLFEIYQIFSKKPERIIHDGVNLEKYIPENLKRFENIEKSVIGWTGNSKFIDSAGDNDMKGVEGILKPAVQELKEEGYDIELNLADRNIKKIPQEEMPKFYNTLSIYVCVSKNEGTPLPVLEAMAMGIPVISTNVGIVKEAFGERQQKYIISRDKEALKDKIKELLNNKSEFKDLSEENLEQIKLWDWKIIAKGYKEFFENNM
jgi:glycosyltransferase involved in cell wall biosynthesis